MDLNADAYDTPDNLNQVLNEALSGWETVYGGNPNEATLSLRFKGIIQRASEQTGEQVVVLVDEYDKPLLNTIDNKELHDAYRNTLKAFFGVLKSQDPYIRFAFWKTFPWIWRMRTSAACQKTSCRHTSRKVLKSWPQPAA